MISTIIFDLSEVLLSGMYGSEAKIGQLIGKPVSPDYLYIQKETWDFFHGKITEDTYWQLIIERSGWELSIPTLKELVRSQMNEIAGTRKIIEKLRAKGYKLGLLSVHAKEWIAHLETKYDYHKHFHQVMYSYQVGVSKPDPQAFKLILESLQVKPTETLFVDDSEENLETAKSLGMHTIHFKNAKELKKELQKRAIAL